MTKNVIYSPLTAEDIAAVCRSYDAKRPGLGDEFLVQLRRTLQHINDYPLSYQRLTGEFRRAQVRRFPLVVLYCFDANADAILVVGVLSTRRDPTHLLERTQGPTH
ncbi:MAG: type II toxin-antitoxin system RelE/ParE family toxin [Phycisphaerales bacterium]|nr:type II toxin-antitoxin system RelE/ParE family toxin [Phycisphaerales bacterium]